MTSGDDNIPDEDFYLRHSVARELYSKLTVNLNRAPDESVQVMAMLMWFQSEICERKGVLAKLLELPDRLFKEIATECFACLRCVQSDIPPFTEGVYEISLLPNFMGLNVTLQVLHEHRLEVLCGVKRLMKDVCFRAFRDLYAKVSKGKSTSPVAVFNSKLFDKFGWEDMMETPTRANEGTGLLKSYLEHERIFALAQEDMARNPPLAIAGRAAGGLNVGSPGIKLLTVELGGEDSCMDELRKIFAPLNCKKFGLNGDLYPGGNKISPVAPAPGRNNYSNAASVKPPPPSSLQKFVGTFKPYIPLPPEASVGYAIIPPTHPQQGHSAPPPTSPAPAWANPTQGNANGYAKIPPSPPPPHQANFASYDPQSGGGMYGGRPYGTNDDEQNYAIYNDIDDLLPDDRTVFLTFSKGYPISASDVTYYFNRKFGRDVIERMYMQIVRPNEQVLFARVVCSSAEVMESIIKGGKAKYNISGRHCWARKYIKKNKNFV